MLFKKAFNSIAYDQAVILSIPLAFNELGSPEERKHIEELINDVGPVLPPHSGVDGHEANNDEKTLYL